MVGFDARVVGANVHANRLRRMRNAQYMQRELVKELMVEGEEIRKEIQDSIRAGGIPSPNHVPSAPGQPPNADTHNLDLSIDVRVPRASGRTSLVVIAQAEYAAALEFGTSRIAERPFMRPVFARRKDSVIQGMVRALRSTVRIA